jgi:hypothetical protein
VLTGEAEMHSAIVVVDIPQNDTTGTINEPKWRAFIANVDRKTATKPDPIGNYEGVKRLAENVWQVNFLAHPQVLTRLVHFAGEHNLPCEILQFDAEPQWLQVGSNPKPS